MVQHSRCGFVRKRRSREGDKPGCLRPLKFRIGRDPVNFRDAADAKNTRETNWVVLGVISGTLRGTRRALFKGVSRANAGPIQA